MILDAFAQPMHQRPSNTAHSNTQFEIVRIIRPHHPLFGKAFPLVRRWKHKKSRFYIIQMPDKSHIQIPIEWADDAKSPLAQYTVAQPVFTDNSIKELIFIITTLKKRISTN